MDRDERKQMIKDVYKKFFGKEPQETLVNTYTNQGVNEEELMKKILDSEEYKKMLEEYQNFKQNEDKSKQNEIEIKNLNQKLRDTERMLENLTKLLKHKRALITRLRYELTARSITLPGEFLDYNTPPQNLPTDQQNPHFTKNS
ncbi:MAG: hypothetical protein KatS3mg085_245 [Candidatus Dojkabacteria bacterium]|nr:MAG: hypothetical protein KatS3mg085_245 [Candidatus Dojkabacteria bacterium]